jgi:DNA replication factor GINS
MARIDRASMADEPFSFESLSKQEALERKQPRLTKLEPDFWEHLRRYLGTLETGLRNEQARSPTSKKISLLQDELRNATRKAESLWEAREKKITLQALKSSRADLAPPPENSIKTEQVLYEELLRAFRQHVPEVVRALKTNEGMRPTIAALPSTPGPSPTAAPTPAPAPVAPAASPSAPASSPAAVKPADEPVTVRALVDVPPFVGLDGKTYRLKKGDVLSLPRRMVDVLSKRGQVAVMS